MIRIGFPLMAQSFQDLGSVLYLLIELRTLEAAQHNDERDCLEKLDLP
jgi:hypothetical protein